MLNIIAIVYILKIYVFIYRIVPNCQIAKFIVYNTSNNNNNIEDNTLTIKQLVLLLKNTHPNKNLTEINTSSFIVNIK